MIEFNQKIPTKYNFHNEFSKESLKLYFSKRWSYYNYESLKNGYVDMSEINLDLAELGIECDMMDLYFYELSLRGREKL